MEVSSLQGDMPIKTLFLDRDGVLNARIPGDYIRDWEAFVILPGVLEALHFFANYFDRILVVTNQQGIGKGLMNEADLHQIHQRFLNAVHEFGGRIDKIYFCPDLSGDNSCRKPNPAMALAAQRDFPEIDFSNAVMVGDSASDMAFGYQLGMQTVLIEGKMDEVEKLEAIPEMINLRFASLLDYACHIKSTSVAP